MRRDLQENILTGLMVPVNVVAMVTKTWSWLLTFTKPG